MRMMHSWLAAVRYDPRSELVRRLIRARLTCGQTRGVAETV
jgi:hypothetical protein